MPRSRGLTYVQLYLVICGIFAYFAFVMVGQHYRDRQQWAQERELSKLISELTRTNRDFHDLWTVRGGKSGVRVYSKLQNAAEIAELKDRVARQFSFGNDETGHMVRVYLAPTSGRRPAERP